jgi:hypothetical protein
MRFPKWVCITCGQPSSRRWNITRHIDICHHGIGRFVPFIEYIADRQRGFLYPPISKHAFHYHSRKKQNNYLDTIQEEFWREYGRQKAKSVFCPRPMIRTDQNFISNSLSCPMPSWQNVKDNGSSMNINMQSSLVNPIDVFGYTGQICENCLQSSVEFVYFEEEGHKQQQQLDHRCEVQILGSMNEFAKHLKNMYTREIQNKLLPLFIKEFIKIDWGGKTIYLLAAKLSEPKSEKLTFQCPTNPTKTVTIQCALEKQIQLDLVNASKNHWAARAIRDNPAILNEHELTDFLYKINKASFAVFNAHTERGLESYFMAVSIFNLQLPRDNNFNNNTLQGR